MNGHLKNINKNRINNTIYVVSYLWLSDLFYYAIKTLIYFIHCKSRLIFFPNFWMSDFFFQILHCHSKINIFMMYLLIVFVILNQNWKDLRGIGRRNLKSHLCIIHNSPWFSRFLNVFMIMYRLLFSTFKIYYDLGKK